MATHPSILAWRIHGQRSLVGSRRSKTQLKRLSTIAEMTTFLRTLRGDGQGNLMFSCLLTASILQPMDQGVIST